MRGQRDDSLIGQTDDLAGLPCLEGGAGAVSAGTLMLCYYNAGGRKLYSEGVRPVYGDRKRLLQRGEVKGTGHMTALLDGDQVSPLTAMRVDQQEKRRS